ncbi:type II CRISPR RNA-guided endonuclease Cas9 [Enterococcus devriesei]|uniref:type II CRISPR RNA-guided endonuclease Cas9 n=1 Tax=Enterococcus devriesei TaxID=319970 RepID=UPI0028B219C6|nr:type II CRISPR RNA-guided endonuclease Cas9 [Enterococcus devriesei]
MDKFENEVNIGFDIGISSVGVTVLETRTGKILESMVSIFPSASAAKNEERRGFRQSRRLIRRKKNRLRDTKELLKKNNFLPINERACENPYELRVRGLSEKLSREELGAALLHLVKRRGISYALSDVEDEGNTGSYKEGINENQKLLKSKYPAEIQLSRLEDFGKVRGQVKDEANNHVLLNVFPNSAYLSEAKQLLETQKEYYSDITEEFQEKFYSLIQRKREYSKGPGSIHSPSDYGIYKTNGDVLDNIFEILIGKDQIFPNEYRAAGNSFTAQHFNVLNDLNNLKIQKLETGKLSTEQKEAIIHLLRNDSPKAVNMLKIVAKVAKVKTEDIAGYRIDRKDKPEFHSMEVYRKVRNLFLEKEIDVAKWPIDLWDRLGYTLTLNTENGEIRRSIEEKIRPDFPSMNDEMVDMIIENSGAFKISSNNKWHRFSLKTMRLLIPEMEQSSKEQMTLLNEMGLLKENKRDYSEKSKINSKDICEYIYNPVVRKSVRQTINIFNELVKKYRNIAYLIIEMPRETNEEEERKNKQKFQRENEKEKSAAEKEFMSCLGISEVHLDSQYRKIKKLRSQIRFWYQQEGKCPYSGKTIKPDDLFFNNSLFEIDHIIPLSVSFDDSMNNKVLCYAEMNQEKMNQTPYAFMQLGQGQGFEVMRALINSNKRMSKTKKNNLLFTENLEDIEVRKRFIARNLVDTRYASRVVLNELQQYVRSKKLDTKVTVVRGKFTSTLRNKWHLNLEKTRDTHYHHAVDASIIAASPMLKLWRRSETIIPKKIGENTIDTETGEILNDDQYKKDVYELPYERFANEVRNQDKLVKFSHQVDKKKNRKVSDATIYATRTAQVGKDKSENEYVLGKIANIYSEQGFKSFKKVYESGSKEFLMERKDPKTFEKLVTILEKYPDHIEEIQDNGSVKKIPISPFEYYRRNNGPITKYAKKNNGPVIRQMKFYDNKIGSAIEITPDETKNKKVILQSLKPWRTDVYFNDETGLYEIMGIKYSDLKFGKKSQYGISKDQYEKIKIKEKISSNSEFVFSLYRNDRIKIIDTINDQDIELLFASRTNPANLGYVELKPMDRSKFGSNEILKIFGKVTPNGQFVKSINKKGLKILKVNTDALGNPFYISKERETPSDILDNAF